MSSFSILFTKSSRNFDEDIFCLENFVGLDVLNTVGSGVDSGVGLGVEVLSRFFIRIFFFLNYYSFFFLH